MQSGPSSSPSGVVSREQNTLTGGRLLFLMTAVFSLAVAGCASEPGDNLDEIAAKGEAIVEKVDDALKGGKKLPANGTLLDSGMPIAHDVTTTDLVEHDGGLHQCVSLDTAPQNICETLGPDGTVDSVSVLGQAWLTIGEGLGEGDSGEGRLYRVEGEGTDCTVSTLSPQGKVLSAQRFTWARCNKAFGPLIDSVHGVAKANVKHSFPAWTPSSSGHR